MVKALRLHYSHDKDLDVPFHDVIEIEHSDQYGLMVEVEGGPSIRRDTTVLLPDSVTTVNHTDESNADLR